MTMDITIIGAGPAGLSTAFFLQYFLDANVKVLEKAERDEAVGVGVTIGKELIDNLRLMDPQLFREYEADFFGPFSDIRFSVTDQDQRNLGTESSKSFDIWSVKRSSIVNFLRDVADKKGIEVEYGQNVSEDRIKSEREISDLVVGADGPNSIVRSTYKDQFRTTETEVETPYVWLRVDGSIDHFVFATRDLGQGLLSISAYPHSPSEGSAVIECSKELRSLYEKGECADEQGFVTEFGQGFLNNAMGRYLNGATIRSENSRWRKFKQIRNEKSHHENVVLVGDAYAR